MILWVDLCGFVFEKWRKELFFNLYLLKTNVQEEERSLFEVQVSRNERHKLKFYFCLLFMKIGG